MHPVPSPERLRISARCGGWSRPLMTTLLRMGQSIIKSSSVASSLLCLSRWLAKQEISVAGQLGPRTLTEMGGDGTADGPQYGNPAVRVVTEEPVVGNDLETEQIRAGRLVKWLDRGTMKERRELAWLVLVARRKHPERSIRDALGQHLVHHERESSTVSGRSERQSRPGLAAQTRSRETFARSTMCSASIFENMKSN